MSPVVDASIAFKWLVEEDHTTEAEALLQDCLRLSHPLLAPPHLTAEVTNALHQRTRRQQHALTEIEADRALARYLSLPIRQVSNDGLYPEAVKLARGSGLRSIYDALYVALAQMLGVELWTADQRLIQTLGTTAPWVRWIGDYPLTQ